jgi:hypothetical protein
MDETNLDADQIARKNTLDTPCSCGSGKKFGFCHGANEACWCVDGLAGKPANESHYNPAQVPAEQQVAAQAAPMATDTPSVITREDDDDGGDFMVE